MLNKKNTQFLKKIVIRFTPAIVFLRNITYNSKIFISLHVFLGLLFSFRSRVTFIKRPRFSKDVIRTSNYNYSNFAICFQGPIDKEFTIETIKIYMKQLPKINIVVSTWNDINKDKNLLKELEELNVFLVLNDYPETKFGNKPGFRATTYQVKSTVSGLKKAKELNCQYAVKHRGDQRAYSSDWLLKLKNLQESYPNNSSSITKQKILLPSITCQKFRIYGIGDQFHFGLTEDLLNFWDNEYYETGVHSLVNYNKNSNFIINGTAIFSEIYLLAKFLEKNNYKLKWSLEDYWQVMKNNFCIFDCSYIDFVFFKEKSKTGIQPNIYTEYREDERVYSKPYEFNFTHADWLSINNMEIKEIPWYQVPHQKWKNNNPDNFPPSFKNVI